MPTGITELQRIPPHIEKPVVIHHPPRIRDERIRREERAQRRVVVAGVVIEQPRPVLLLAGEGAVGINVLTDSQIYITFALPQRRNKPVGPMRIHLAIWTSIMDGIGVPHCLRKPLYALVPTRQFIPSDVWM